MIKIKILILTLSLIPLFGCHQSAKSKNITLTWDHSPEAQEIVKYVVYEKQNTSLQKLQETTTNTIILSNLSTGQHIYTVTAINKEGVESAPAKEITVNVP